MLAYYGPILLIIASNVMYNLVTRNTPADANLFLSLTVTYLAGAVVCALVYAFTNAQPLAVEWKRLNGTSLLLSAAIMGIEIGYLYLYRAGWKLSVGSLVANIALAVVLLILGALCYHEKLSLKQIAGMALCVAGLALING